MKAESTIKPKSYSVEKCGGLAEVVLYENIVQMTRENLAAEIKANRAAWLETAKDIEENAAEKLSLEEQVKKLAAENAALKADSELMGAALEEVIAAVAGGE